MTLDDVLTIMERVLDEELAPRGPAPVPALDLTAEHAQLNALKGEILDEDGTPLFTLAPLLTPDFWDAFVRRRWRR